MRDFDPIDPSTSCLDAVLFRTGGTLPPPELIPNPFKDSFVFKVGPLSPPFVFTLDRSGAKRIRMLIDGPGLARLFQSSFTCRSSGTCPSGNSSINAPCMSGFTEFTTAQLLPLITFE
jgi:hypothetical protein